MSSTEEKLIALGDPSGQQNEVYWNAWFEAVCYNNEDDDTNNNRTYFEWYTGVEEVQRVLEFHLLHQNDEQNRDDNEKSSLPSHTTPTKYSFIHPGGGNSLVPFHLSNCSSSDDDKEEDTQINDQTTSSTFLFQDSQHVVVDVSDVAIKSVMKHYSDHPKFDSIQFYIQNVLDPPLTFNPSDQLQYHQSSNDEDDQYYTEKNNFYHGECSFDAWIDKGLLDALFSGKDESDDELCERLFREAHRLLRDGATVFNDGSSSYDQGGFMVIITMAEEHSLKLILSNWLRPSWKKSLHVHELLPSSGTVRPFAFVLHRESSCQHHTSQHVGESKSIDAPWCMKFHTFPTTDLPNPTTISISSPMQSTVKQLNSASLSDAIDKISQVLNDSRARYCEEQKKANNSIRRVLGTIEIKPSSAEVDLKELCFSITSKTWGFDTLQWYQEEKEDNASAATKQPNDDDKSLGKIIPIGFGISKLVLQCIIDANDLESLCESILDQECTDTEDDDNDRVQSVDVDWDSTFPIGDL